MPHYKTGDIICRDRRVSRALVLLGEMFDALCRTESKI